MKISKEKININKWIYTNQVQDLNITWNRIVIYDRF